MKAEFDRIKSVANEYFGGFSGLTKKINRPRSFFYKYQGEVSIGNKVLMDLEAIGINPKYISEGQKPIFLNLSHLEDKFKEKYLRLDSDNQKSKSVREVDEEYSNAKMLPTEKALKTLEFFATIPLYKQIAYANQGTVIPDIDQFHVGEVTERLPIKTNNPKNFGAIEITGDSMSGFGIVSGSTVIFNTEIELKSGQIVVLILNGHLMVKQLIINNGEYEFHSNDNGKTKPIVGCPDDVCKVIGVVTDVHHKFI